MKQHDIFISYKSDDYETAVWLRSVLETNGIPCWMAPTDIPGGSNYAKEIPIAIERCKVLVVVLSSRTQDSIWVPKELDTAINKGKVIMPFMVDDISLRDDFNFYLSNVQRYSAYESKTAAIEKMITEIRAILQAKSGVSPAPDQQPATVPQPAAARQPASDAAVQARPRKKKPLWIVLAVAALLLAAAAIAWLTGLFSRPGSPAPDPGDAQEAQAAVRPPMHITLYVPNDMTVREFNTAQSILKERLDILTGGQEYQWKAMEDQIDLMIPASAFAELQPESVLRCYLSRPAEIYLIDLSDKTKYTAVKRDDIEKVTLLNGTIAGFNPAEYGIGTPTYQYIEIVLKDSFIAAHPEIKNWEKPVFAQDVETHSDLWFYFCTIPTADQKTFYMVNNDLGGYFSELVVYNMTHEPLPKAFTFIVDLSTSTDWQDPADTAQPGKNQCAMEKARPDSVIFTLRAGQFTAGQKMDAESVLKARLDAFGSPYAFGVVQESDKNLRFVVMMPARQASLSIIDLLRQSYSFSLQAGLVKMSLSFSTLQVSGDPDNSGFTLTCASDASKAETLKELGAFAVEKDVPVYLTLDNFPLFTVQREELARDGAMRVTGFCDLENNRVVSRPIDQKTMWIVDVMQSVLQHPSLPLTLTRESCQLGIDSSGNLMTEKDFLIPWLYDKDALAALVKPVCPDAQVYVKNSSVSVSLDLPVDGELPLKAPELAKQIYEALDFEHLDAKQLAVYLISENDETSERARIFFSKNPQTIYSSDKPIEEGYLYAYGIFRNGRLTPYSKLFMQTVESMEFYQNLTHDLTFWTVE